MYKKRSTFFATVVLLICFIGITPLLASAKTGPEIKIFDKDGKVKGSFSVFYSDYVGNSDIAIANFSNGEKKIVASRGSGNAPIIEIFKTTGEFEYLLDVFDLKFKGGSSISTGDVDGDGNDEFIVSAGYRGGPQIRIFKSGGLNISNFFVYSKDERTGVKAIAADIIGDGKAEIIAGPNLNREAEIKVFDYKGKELKSKKIELAAAGGINLAAGDVNGDGKKEIIIGAGYGNKSQVIILDSNLEIIKEMFPYGENYINGVNVASGDFDGDGKDEIVVAPAFNGDYKIKVLKIDGTILNEFTAFENVKYKGGLALAVGDIDNDKKIEIIAIPQRIAKDIKSQEYKFIEVNLKTQELSFWQDGKKLDTFLISSGKAKTPTPKGSFKIYNKRANVRMAWYYGRGNPMNYDLPNVPWVLSFSGPYTIHGTYWHSNFGHQMSHGCVNMYTPHAKLIYDWADLGTPIIIY